MDLLKNLFPLVAVAFLSLSSYKTPNEVHNLESSLSNPVEEHFDFSEQKNVAVFSGHIPEIRWPDYPGAMSATGVREYRYNNEIVSLFENESDLNLNIFENKINYIPILSERRIIFKERVDTAKSLDSDIYIEIHHDSGYPVDIRRRNWDRLSGFSFHILPPTDSIPTKYYDESLFLAQLMGDRFLERGFNPNTKLRGGYELVDSTRGIYHRENLRVLKDASMSMPAVLVEAGNIINPLEEELMSKPETKREVFESIDEALRTYFSLNLSNQNSFNLNSF